MNMEDRLREAFEHEAEHLHAPSGSPETAIRRGRRRRASNLIGGAALVVALIGGTAIGVQVLGTSGGPGPAADDPAGTAPVADATGDEPGAGPEESAVAVAPDIAFDWERIELDVPEGADVWNVLVAALGDRFVAVGNGYTGADDLGVLTWTSPNGRDWTLSPTGAGLTGTVDQIFSTGEGFLAVVRSYDGVKDQTLLYSSPDGVNWTAGTADLGALDDSTFSWFSGAASGNGTIVLAGTLQSEPPEPPVVFEDWGVVLEQNRFDGGFAVIDMATGETITTVAPETIYGGEEIAVYGADGTLLFAIPWEMLADEGDGGTESGGGVTVTEIEGYRVEMDFGSYTYAVTDVATGEVVAQGSQEDLYRPPRIVVTDPATGETVLDVDIETFYEAQERAYGEGIPAYLPKSEAIVLVSDDGVGWDRIEVPQTRDASEGLEVSGAVFGADGFIVSVFQYGPEFRSEVLRSSDGRSWELLDSTAEPRQGGIVARDGRYFALGSGGRSGVAVSDDAVDWTQVHDAPGRDVFYNTLAAGDFGIVALGQSQEFAFGPPLTISKDGRTLILDYRAGTFTVVEDATGEELTVVEFDIWDEDAPDRLVVDEETGTLTILDEAGTELMTITEEEGEAASRQLEEQYGDFYDEAIPSPAVAFSPDGDGWFTVSTDGLDVAWAQSMAVGRDSVVIVGESLDAYAEEWRDAEAYSSGSDGDTPATTVVSTEPYPVGSPRVHIWVGTAR